MNSAACASPCGALAPRRRSRRAGRSGCCRRSCGGTSTGPAARSRSPGAARPAAPGRWAGRRSGSGRRRRPRNRSSSRVSVVLPPPERPTRPTFVPGVDPRATSRRRAAAARRVAERHVRSSTRVVRAARTACGGSASTTAGGSSSSSVNCAASVSGALEVAVDAVELPHHARRRRVVAEGEEHRLEAGAGRSGWSPARRPGRACSSARTSAP